MTFKPTIALNETEFLNQLKDIIDKLPAPIDLDDSNAIVNEDSLNAILKSEMILFNQFLKMIHKTCFELQLTIQGTITLTPMLESVLESIRNNKIPICWQQISYQSQKQFSSYLIDFCDRLKWMQNRWLADQLPEAYWISAFFYPRSFFGAIQLDFARKHQQPLEQITIDFIVVNEKNASEAGNEDAQINGLYLEAAHWNGCFIEEQIAHQPIQSFPIVNVKPMKITDFNTNSRFECPIYYTLLRRINSDSSLITRIWLPTKDGVGSSHWIKRGVALGCHID